MTSSIKVADTQYPIHELLRNRWSARSFSDQSISSYDMNRLLEAASWSFSANNMQTWRYVYAHRHSPRFGDIWDCLAGGNRPWAKNAAALVICLAQTNRNTEKPNIWASHDLGAANMNLVLQALSMDIYAHVMGGFDASKALALSQANRDEWEVVAMLALGYLDAPDQLEEPFRTRELTPRTRKSIADFAWELS